MEGEPQNFAGNRATSPLPADVVAQEARMMAGWDMHPTFRPTRSYSVRRTRMIDDAALRPYEAARRAKEPRWDPDALLEAPTFLSPLPPHHLSVCTAEGSTCTTRRSPGEAAHNVTPKKHVEYALHQPRNFVRLSQVFPRVTQVGGALAHDNLDDDESIRMACATAAAVNGAIAEGAIFEAAKGKEGITEVLKSAVVDPPVGGKRTRMATRALHRGEDDGKRPKTCGVGNGARHRTDNSSGSMTSRPLTGGESNGLADIHNLQVDVLVSRGSGQRRNRQATVESVPRGHQAQAQRSLGGAHLGQRDG